MIDFTGVKAITIPEGSVAKIMRGSDVLWAKPTSGGLPVGYTRLAYLRSSGTQYINTGYKPNSKTRVVATVQFDAAPKAHAGLFGARTASTEQYWTYYRYNDLTVATRYGTAADIKITATSTEKLVVEQNQRTLTTNGTSVSAAAQTFASPYEMYLFSVNQSGATQYTSSFRLYDCQIYDDGTMVRDYVPCINPGGEYGLYDRVSGVFYGNAGTGAFAGGLADYVQFTGEQTVDTGIIPDYNTTIEISFTRESDGNAYLYGVRSSGNTASVTAYLGSNSAWRFGNTYRNMTLSVGSKIHSAVVSKTGIVMNGSSGSYGATVKDFTAIATLTLGSARTADGSYGATQFVGKIYGIKIYSSGTLVANFDPWVKDGVYGFMDHVSGEFKSTLTDTPLQGG